MILALCLLMVLVGAGACRTTPVPRTEVSALASPHLQPEDVCRPSSAATQPTGNRQKAERYQVRDLLSWCSTLIAAPNSHFVRLGSIPS